MTLKQLLRPLGIEADNMEITGLTADSRQAAPGCVFVAVKGVGSDGHDYIARALEAGAAAVVCEHRPEGCDPDGKAAWAIVPDSAAVLGTLGDEYYGHPSSKLALVGVTGTNGKTTIATLLYEMSMAAGVKAGLLSTVVNRIGQESVAATHTTPDTLTIHRLLARMVEAGCGFCAMEVSSHACQQQRIAGLKFAGGIFTNLTRDHLDYHKTFANYLAAKKRFFDSLGPDAFALTNADDRNGMVMLQNTGARPYTYSVRASADFTARIEEDSLEGMTLVFSGSGGVPVHTPFTGRFNASNLTAVYGAWRLLGHDAASTLVGISTLVPVAGRMQAIRTPRGVTAIVDYAHTPDALANTLGAIAEATRGHRIITVAGAGGDRDPGKRPLMAAEALKASDVLIITSDNPRTEDPAAIAEQMLAGVAEADRGRVEVILDRAAAIAAALDMARPGEAVLIAGKGHEDYQIIGTEKRHFDDREEVVKYINKTQSTK